MDKYYFLNDEIILSQEAKLHISDLAITRGYGIFDFLRTANRKPLFFEDHLRRFNNSASAFSLPLSFTDDAIHEAVNKLLVLNGFSESSIKLILTGGYSVNGFDPGKPNFAIMVDQLIMPDKKYYEEGVKLISLKHIREFHYVKSTNYLTAILTAPKCKAANAIDVLFHDGKYISEVTRSNFFIFKEGVLITPNAGILEGITRSKILKIASGHFPVEERDVLLSEVYEADEAFITSSSKRIMPVVTMDETTIGEGIPGENTIKLARLFIAYEQEYVSKI